MCEPKEIPMTDKITSFKLNWYDCGLCCADDAVQEELAIYRNNNYMVFKELNGYGVICSCEIIHIDQDRVSEFFDFLEKTSDKWETDYKVPVCDGSAWEVRMWHSSHKVKKVCGTAEWHRTASSGRAPSEFCRCIQGGNHVCGFHTGSALAGNSVLEKSPWQWQPPPYP